MRHFLLAVTLIALAGTAFGQEPALADGDRMFLPRDMFWGFGQFEVAPPHNEIDPNVCRADAGSFGGVNAPCTAFARYSLSGLLEVRPFGRGPLRRFMLFGEPKLSQPLTE